MILGKGTFMWAVKQKKDNLNLDIRRKKKPEWTLASNIIFYHISKDEIKELTFEDVDATDWEVVKEPKDTLWKKGIINATYGQCFSENDVKEALKEFIDYMDYLLGDIHFIERKNKKAKEIFGEEL